MGLEQGPAHERTLLRRQAASRFGADTAERLTAVLAGIADPERLVEAGEWLPLRGCGGHRHGIVVRDAGRGAHRRGVGWR